MHCYVAMELVVVNVHAFKLLELSPVVVGIGDHDIWDWIGPTAITTAATISFGAMLSVMLKKGLVHNLAPSFHWNTLLLIFKTATT